MALPESKSGLADEATISMLRENISTVRERIASACQRSRRDPAEITLVAVSKTFGAERVRIAYELGQRDFGENRVQEAAEKIPLIDAPLIWHLIGHLQTNKAKRAAELFDMIQSVDSVRVATAISSASAALGKQMPVLLEVNVSGEASKFGLAPAQLPAAVEGIAGLPSVAIKGLMTVAPIVSQPDESRPYFAQLRRLRDDMAGRYPQIEWRHLSMGMTDDFEAAIAEGATILRVGRAIFGDRPVAK